MDTHLSSDLNPVQQDAVTTAADHNLILAGAGSGKTRVLVARIAWLIQNNQVPAAAIMAVTFTNKAAAEMRQRIEQMLGFTPQGLWVGTFHSLAHRLLRMHHQQAGLSDAFHILDQDDQLRMVRQVIKSLDLDEERWNPRQAQYFINGQKDEGVRPENMEVGNNLYQRVMRDIYLNYQGLCKKSNSVDFAELLLRSHELWLNNDVLLTHYQQRFHHILVDEFQDTNAIQYAWLRVLAGAKGHLMVVGDDDQSIYGWRGAKIENMQRFTEDFPNAKTVRLEQNYRSSAVILKAANTLIEHNSNRLGKQLWTEGEQGEPIRFYAAFNEVDEARFVCDQVKQATSNGESLSDMAILYRSNAQSRVLEEALIRTAIPYRIYGGQRFFERAEIKNVLAYLRLAMNRHDNIAFDRVINTPARGIGSKTLTLLHEHAEQNSLSLWQAACAMIDASCLSTRAATAILSFMACIDAIEEDNQSLALEAVVQSAIQRTGLVAHHKKEPAEKAQARLENLEELLVACREFDPESLIDEQGQPVTQASALTTFLDHTALESGNRQSDDHQDSIQLMTLHAVKGLEFNRVFMVGVEEGLLPHKMSLDAPGGVEEERRLAYVGITRAQHYLTMTYAQSRRLYGLEKPQRVSRFIREIPATLLREVRIRASQTTQVTASWTQQDPEAAFWLGQKVQHAVFGEGVVLNCEGQGSQARVQVNFATEGSKWLMLSYAKLQKLEG